MAIPEEFFICVGIVEYLLVSQSDVVLQTEVEAKREYLS